MNLIIVLSHILLINNSLVIVNTGTLKDDPIDCGTLIRCPLTNICAESYFLCPQTMSCNSGLTKCNEYTCSIFEEDSCEEKKCKNVTCWNNICVDKQDECPSYTHCKNSSDIRCADNSCVQNITDCPDYRECPYFIPYRCPNGDCRKRKEDCPQNITCPNEAPYLCNDGSCKVKKLDCGYPVSMTSCIDKSMTRCSDGSCTPAKFLCPTLKTCPINMILCFNGLCANTLEECFSQQKKKSGTSCLESNKVLCPNSQRCVNHIDDCPTSVICPLNKSVKCWDGSCRESISKCPEYTACPSSMVECPDGSCAKKNCGTPITCSRDAPFKCLDNTCKRNPNDCPILNDCPPSKPFYCWDGTCNMKREECISMDTCNANAPVKCPDGMCRSNIDECRNIDFCPIGFSYIKEGICSVEMGELNPNVCPQYAPIRCLDGLCMISSSFCKSDYSESVIDLKNYICADGEIVNNLNLCKVTFQCQIGKVKCPDNSCKLSVEECAQTKNTCPENRNYRCDNGECAVKKEFCLNSSGCQTNTPYKCSNNGLCVLNQNECQNNIFTLSNGCPKDKPNRCKEGKVGECVERLDIDCYIDHCPNEPKRVFCPESGQCAETLRECNGFDPFCPENMVTCPDKTCKSNLSDCNNSDGCKLSNPIRCINGQCKKYSTSWINSKQSIEDYSCDMGIICPDYKPYLCINGSCVEKSYFCLPFKSIKDKELCFDRTFSEDCNNKIKKCPAHNPILCSNTGNCVSSVFDCILKKCPTKKPIKCASGLCTDNPQECMLSSIKCEEFETMCYDGTCRKNISQCPLYKGCTDLNFPYKCKSGKCAVNASKCDDIEFSEINNEKTILDFKDDPEREIKKKKLKEMCLGKKLCEDGICRENCPNFNGCPNDKPLMCSLGMCVKSLSECAGISNCESIDKPFRCINNVCQSSLSECNKVKKTQDFTKSIVFSHVGKEIHAELVVSDNNEVLTKVYIPSNNFIVDSQLKDTVIYTNLVSMSTLHQTSVKYDETRRDDILSVFPFGDKKDNLSLEYEYSILSHAISLNVEEVGNPNSNVKFINPILLTMAFDFPENIKTIINEKVIRYLDPFKDVCIGKLNFNEQMFNCIESEQLVTDFSMKELHVSIKESGIYAVILNPKTDNSLLEFEVNFIIKNFLIISIVLGSLLIVSGIGFYVFVRIYRYRSKYKSTKNNTKLIESKMQEMQNLGSTHVGQTIGDSIDNILYTNNPFYKKEKVLNTSARAQELSDLLEKFEKREKQLESNNQILIKKIESLKEEIDRLEEYKKLKNE